MCNLQQGLLVEEVSGKQETVLRRELFECARDGMDEAVEFGGEWRDQRGWCSGYFAPFNGFQGCFAVGSAVMIDVALGQGGAKPSKQGTTTRVGGEWRPAFAA